jgi:hypothetical protein
MMSIRLRRLAQAPHFSALDGKLILAEIPSFLGLKEADFTLPVTGVSSAEVFETAFGAGTSSPMPSSALHCAPLAVFMSLPMATPRSMPSRRPLADRAFAQVLRLLPQAGGEGLPVSRPVSTIYRFHPIQSDLYRRIWGRGMLRSGARCKIIIRRLNQALS